MEHNDKISTSHRRTPLLLPSVLSHILVILAIVILLVDRANSCFTSAYHNERRYGTPSPFIRDENRPQTAESSFMASGPLHYKDVVFNTTTLKKLDSTKYSNIEFSSRDANLMTENCWTHVSNLAFFVQNEWKGAVKLKIIRAWQRPRRGLWTQRHSSLIIPYKLSRDSMDFSAQDFHSAGRAVDFTITDPTNPSLRIETMNLGKLAQLAYYEAKFNWCYYEGPYIHCSVKAAPLKDRGGRYACFPETSTVVLDSGVRRPLSQLRIGDRVLAVDPNNGKAIFSPVEMFFHREVQTIATYLRLKTSQNGSLTLSENHLVYRLLSGSRSFIIDFSTATEAIFARDIRIGDRLLTTISDESVLRPVEVISRETVSLRGVYAPLTASGNIVVDEHVASCYAHISSERLARWALLPYRLFLRFWHTWALSLNLKTSTHTDTSQSVMEGVHWYVEQLHVVAKALLPSSWLFPD